MRPVTILLTVRLPIADRAYAPRRVREILAGLGDAQVLRHRCRDQCRRQASLSRSDTASTTAKNNGIQPRSQAGPNGR